MGANAQTSVPAFTAGQVLTAAQVTGINTGIPVFASSTERDAAFGGTGEKTLAEGQMAYLEDTNATQYYDGSSWAAIAGGTILQVVSTTITDTYSASVTAGGNTDPTSFEATITPSSATNKVFISAMVNGSSSVNGSQLASVSVLRDATDLANPTSPGSRVPLLAASRSGEFNVDTVTVSLLDSPATTSATTYKVRLHNTSGSTQTLYLNRADDDTDASSRMRTVSTITLFEVSA